MKITISTSTSREEIEKNTPTQISHPTNNIIQDFYFSFLNIFDCKTEYLG